jgi:indolepyruvate ferredoxin oxidoreductase
MTETREPHSIARTPSNFSLQSKYLQEEGTVLLSGVQALVRLVLDQHRADRRHGLNTATFISGYRGSPLGGLDIVLQHNRDLLEQHQVVFVPGVNEDLAATAVFGSQAVNLLPGAKYDGVLGMWYGKSPGVDRSGDAFKHANFAGTGRYGGVLAVAGDDPGAKSSTLPTQSEVAFYDAVMPIIYPGNVQDVLDLGRLGFELSRYCGLWVGFKIVANVADAFSSVEVAPDRIVVRKPDGGSNGQAWQPVQNLSLLPPHNLQIEAEIHERRLGAARDFAAAHPLNRITAPTPGAWLGIVAAGKTYYDVREALKNLGLGDRELLQYGIRLLKVGLLYPIEPGLIRDFGRGLEEILVLEEKRAFVELFLHQILYGQANCPRIVGKQDEQGNGLVPPTGELDVDQISRILATRITRRVALESITARLHILQAAERPSNVSLLTRQPYFCSGCPHNRSTLVPDGSIAGGGIGCHTMALSMNRHTVGLTQMGGEGANWVGMAPFTSTPHLFQNLGDGTLFHSGSLAIRQAIAANANITYKILFNSAVAMTGGQTADGAMPLPELTQTLRAEGVNRILVLSNQPKKYSSKAQWADNVEIWHRDRLDEAERLLRETVGVTVLIYDQECAAELRRKRKRGFIPDPALRIVINEAICEGCGDCGAKSNCLSVQPVETEFGRKTQIHQSSCNKDYSCLAGDCPAFMTIVPRHEPQRQVGEDTLVDVEIPEPDLRRGEACSVYLMGIGGTGVVTVSQILGTAALLSGKQVTALDQTGLAQKGGQVVSNLKISGSPIDESNRVAVGMADVYLVFDLLTGANANNLSRVRYGQTVAVVSTSKVPTGAMIQDVGVQFPNVEFILQLIESCTGPGRCTSLDAQSLAETLFGDAIAANMIVLGAAYQMGTIPIPATAIEQAIGLNGVEVRMNQQAFRVGRLLVAKPQRFQALISKGVGSVDRQAVFTPETETFLNTIEASGELKRLLAIRIPELTAYQDKRYAERYLAFVKRVIKAEQRLMPGESRLSEAVARYLFKLMAYKDEYEVARLCLNRAIHDVIGNQFGVDAKVEYLLHPPFLRALGWQRKLRFGAWFKPIFRGLVAMRRLRGTRFDLFGRTPVRQVERGLIQEYERLVGVALDTLSADSYEWAIRLATLPDMIRGYEGIKMKNVRRFCDEVAKLAVELPANRDEFRVNNWLLAFLANS